jgi:hypothetical protein
MREREKTRLLLHSCNRRRGTNKARSPAPVFLAGKPKTKAKTSGRHGRLSNAFDRNCNTRCQTPVTDPNRRLIGVAKSVSKAIVVLVAGRRAIWLKICGARQPRRREPRWLLRGGRAVQHVNLLSESAKVFRSRWRPIAAPAGASGVELAESLTPSRIPPLEKAHYDHRIDFFRGLSLIFIFINHIPENAFTYLTSRTFTLFDSAEVFMFLAGFSAALGYYGLAPQGLQAFSRKALARARAIWTYHLVLVALLMTSAFVIGETWGVKTGYEIFLDRIASDPWQVLMGSALLAFQAPLLDILPMYVIVMLLAPFLIWMRVRSELALLSASGLIWMFSARFFPSIPTMTYDVAWSFNPFCWQFLFAIGLAFGWRTRTAMPPVAAGDGRRILDFCCAAFVVFSAFVLMTIAFHTIDDTGANRLRAMYFSLNKQCLDLWRVVGLLASAYLVARLVPKEARWLRLSLPRWVCAAGAASLPIFSLTVVLSFAGKFFVQASDGSVVADGIATGVGVVIILAVALALKAGIFQALAGRILGAPAAASRAQARQ